MSRIRGISVVALLGCASFLAVLRARARNAPEPTVRIAASAGDTLERDRLDVLGLKSGVYLVAYEFGSANCGYCSLPDIKAAFAGVRPLLTSQLGDRYTAVRVVGVAINKDFGQGMGYLESIGLDRFDEISVGSGWLNEHVNRLIWRDPNGEASVPQVVVLARRIAVEGSTVVTITPGRDSIMIAAIGHQEILEWVRQGAPLDGRGVTQSRHPKK